MAGRSSSARLQAALPHKGGQQTRIRRDEETPATNRRLETKVLQSGRSFLCASLDLWFSPVVLLRRSVLDRFSLTDLALCCVGQVNPVPSFAIARFRGTKSNVARIWQQRTARARTQQTREKKIQGLFFFEHKARVARDLRTVESDKENDQIFFFSSHEIFEVRERARERESQKESLPLRTPKRSFLEELRPRRRRSTTCETLPRWPSPGASSSSRASSRP